MKATDPYEALWPFNYPDLPSEFAKVHDSKSAIRFELKYAPLDYDSLVVDPKDRNGGDPLDWVLEHAHYVRSTLELVHALAMKDGSAALRLFDQFRVDDKNYDHPALKGTGELTFPSGAYKNTTLVPAPRSDEDALWYAPSIITLLVNNNTRNIYEELILDSKGRIIPVQFYRALAEAIWSMVGTLAVKAQQDEERPYFKICKGCGTPFFAKDKRQLYCPPIKGQQSHCGLISRQHRFQAKKSN